jgi:hypothetical protein
MGVTSSRPRAKIFSETAAGGYSIALIEDSEVDDQPLLRGNIKRLFSVDAWRESSSKAADYVTQIGMISARGQLSFARLV